MAFFPSVFDSKTPAIVHDKKSPNTLVSTIRAGVIGLSMLIINPTLLYAQDKTMDLSQRITDLPQHISDLQIQKVKVILVDPGSYFRAPLNEDTLGKAGCIYSTRDPFVVINLKSILKRNEVTAVADFVLRSDLGWEYPFLLRNGIYLTLIDGTVVKLFFDDGDSRQNVVSGIFKHPLNFKNTSFTALNSLPQDIRKWASAFAVLDAKSPDKVATCGAAIHP
ncbi:hypothetical protein [Undibacterium sp.]|uniref:hypothetical protein n=1 Tax=Undibacterium sp. TaxID=1914977 RepID=UPI0025EDD6AD|nr:hypothetical protein [Undibacterium sp.]